MLNPIDRSNDHNHHKLCVYHSQQCPTCPSLQEDASLGPAFRVRPVNTYKRPTYRHTAKPPWVDFEKQRELVPRESAALENPVEGHPVTVTDDIISSPIGLVEKMTTCRITFDGREPERSDSGKAITIHQCEAHLVIITWDES